jgi:hypothetical protein
MNDKIKKKLLSTLHELYLEVNSEENNEDKFKDVDDIFNMVKIVDSYEEFQPDIKKMLCKKAYKDKWNNEK